MALPAASVSLAHPLRHDFDYLSEQSARSKVVFRVFDDLSTSPISWNGERDTSGFSCPNQNLAGLIPSAYRSAQGDKRGSITWAEGNDITLSKRSPTISSAASYKRQSIWRIKRLLMMGISPRFRKTRNHLGSVRAKVSRGVYGRSQNDLQE